MIAFSVTVWHEGKVYRFPAIARHVCMVAIVVINEFGVCPFSAIPKRRKS